MRQLLYLSAIMFVLSACGQTGPLYIPQDEPEPATSTDPATTE